MNEQKKYEIAVLAEDHENKRLRLEMLKALNVAGRTAEERVKMSIDYHIADTELSEAWHKLCDAKTRAVYG
jgi:hypothetical protein